MSVRLRIVVAVLLTMVAIGSADIASAAVAGGSRLEAFYTQTSFESGATPGSARTIFTVTNNNTSTGVNARYVVYRGSNCAVSGTAPLTFAPGETKFFDLSSVVTPASFPSGILEFWATTAGGTAIRWDWFTGTSIVLDQGSTPNRIAVVPAVKMFSDDRSGTQGNTIPDQNVGNTAAPLQISVPFPGQGGGITDTIFLFSPAIVPGAAPPPSTGTAAFNLNYVTLAGARTTGSATANCVYSSTLSGAFGPPAAAGGRVEVAGGGGGHGTLGWKFSNIHIPGLDILMGELIQAFAGFTFTSSDQ